MKHKKCLHIACAIAAVLVGSSVFAAELIVVPSAAIETPARPARPPLRAKPTDHVVVEMPSPELTDIAGVTLAAIQELRKETQELANAMKEKDIQLQVKDAEIAELQDQLKALGDGFAARLAALEQQQQRVGIATQTVSLKRVGGPLGE